MDPKKSSIPALKPDIYRVIDANLNRLKEGIRVIEDIARYLQNNKALASELKLIRHKSKTDDTALLLNSRDSINDVLKKTISSELNRKSLEDILLANYKRAQESSRVLEEMYKIINPIQSEKFKEIRYSLYTLEKENLGL